MEPNLLLRPSFGPHTTVHRFATHKIEKNIAKGLLHGITEQEIVVPRPPPGSDLPELHAELIKDTNIELQYKNPFDKVTSSVIINVSLFKSKQCDDDVHEHLGRYLTGNDIKHSWYVEDTPLEGFNAKLQIILATSTFNKYLHLVSVAFKNIPNLCKYKFELNREYFKAFFDKLSPISTNASEVMSGGMSNGLNC